MIGPDTVLAGRYRLIEQIDSGGSAYIYKAMDELTKQIVAVKVLKPELTENEEFVQRFKKEVQAAAKLRHANIIRAYDAGLDNGTYYIVMDLIEGKTLKHLINVNGPLPIKYAVAVAKKICLALEYAHVKGFVHRDIKPHNVMIDMTGEPYIADFGIARNLAQNTITAEEGSVMGSVHYFSPEQARGERVDKRSDIYSLGILIYEMVTGKVPFDADTSVAIALKHINDPMPDARDEMPSIPESINKIIQKATQKDKHFRYKSAFNMYEDLQRCLSEPDGEYVKYSESKRTQQHLEEAHAKRSKQSVKRLILTFGVAAVVVFAIIAIVSAVINFNAERPVPLQNFVGMTEKNAVEAAQKITSMPTITYENSSEAEKGVVIRQDPAAGTAFKKEDPLTLVVSNGTGSDIMPNVTDMDITQARKILLENGIELNQIVEDTKGDMPVGYVIEQHPAAGESVTQSGSVWLTVKASPDVQKVVIPNVQSMNIADALGVLKLRDLSLFFIYEKGSSEQKGVVISQSPQENTELATDKPVMLTIPEPEGRRYRLSEPIDLNIPKDATSLRIGVPGDIDGTPVYYIIYDTMVESGDHAIEPTGTIIMDSDEETIQKDIVIFLDGIQVKTESVEFTRR
ncbi:protein kinase domain-containing protein [Christensenella tenuis]|jgi:eukaryotic-like serine/threonine-protein kinase|uniref:non-specific serine/threonine protein kinase n=1 Tax=Christensenella tenuis TaxID=2763033 RepID=A0ABR7EBB1_9FIRM|nr:protein kinase [Christensenella tenuis]MBC5647070.1 protein kinase [Christensenella tenuis]